MAAGSVVVARRLSCPLACRSFLSQDQTHAPHGQEDSSPLGHQGSPLRLFKDVLALHVFTDIWKE